ncbi:hypothetical protein ACFOLA_05510 [Salinicoccus hispanicus]|nr:hypothetical protein [Salinicoccus hispanicus]
MAKENEKNETPLHKHDAWYSFLFEMFLSSFGLIMRMIKSIISAL